MLNPLYTAVSWVLLKWHALWTLAFGDTSGVTWALSIAFLVMTVRLILFPLFVKQIHSQRAMQELQPKLKELQKKHKGDKETLQRETMAMYKEHGANPVAGCLPIVLQAPVFLSLFHVLRRLSPDNEKKTLYSWTTAQFDSASHARLLGAPISAHFNISAADLSKLSPDATTLNVKLVTGVLIAVMVVTTYLTQRQMMARQATSGQLVDSQQQMVQRLMLYGIPASLLISGSLFPLGVVIYWCTTNLWSMGQQFYVLRKLPPPGGAASERVEDPEEAAVKARAMAPRPGARPGVRKSSSATGSKIPSSIATNRVRSPQNRTKSEQNGATSAAAKKAAPAPGVRPRRRPAGAGTSNDDRPAGAAQRSSAPGKPKGARSEASAGRVPGAKNGARTGQDGTIAGRPASGATSNASATSGQRPAEQSPGRDGQPTSSAPRKPRSR